MLVTRLEKEYIAKVLKEGKGFNTPLFSIKFLKNPLNTTKICISVSKKEAKKAVSRNFIKRRIRSLILKHKDKITEPVLLVVLARKQCETVLFKDLELKFLTNFKELKLL